MHLLRIDSTSLDDTAIAVDLEQSIAPLVFLSFTDSDLAALGAAWQKAALSQTDGFKASLFSGFVA